MRKFIHTIDPAIRDMLIAEGYELVYINTNTDKPMWTLLDEDGIFCFSKYKDNVKSNCLITDKFSMTF